MNVTISINGQERRYAHLVEKWITDRLKEVEAEGGPVCVKVTVSGGEVDLIVTSGGCSGGGGGGGRRPNVLEAEIFERWNKRGLNELEIKPGPLIAFLHQLKP